MGLHDKEAAARDAGQKKIDDSMRKWTSEIRDSNNKSSFSGGGNSGCFSADTRIATPYGQTAISKLKRGDEVQTLNTDTGTVQHGTILRVVAIPNVRIWTIHFENGRKLRTTKHHSFMNNEGVWRTTKGLEAGEFIKTRTGFEKIEYVSENCINEKVYNLIVSGNYTFLAEECVSHSFTKFRSVRMAMYKYFIEPFAATKGVRIGKMLPSR